MGLVSLVRPGLLLLSVGAALLSLSCEFGPSPERIACLQGCARDKDRCLLAATNAEGVITCDGHSRECNDTCRQ
jgi:hypothetical protein